MLVFYGWLLLVTPAFSGVFQGRLPIEISTRGARFAEEANRSVELDEAVAKRLEATTKDLAQGLADANLKIDQLAEITDRDNAQPKVDSQL